MADMHKFEALKHDVLRHGGFYLHFYFDMHASDPTALQNIMVGFVGKLTNEEGVRLAVGEVDEPLKRDELYSTTAKVSMLVSDLPTLAKLVMNYAPIGIELEEPLEARVTAGELQTALMNVSAITQDFTRHILTTTLNPEEKIHFQNQMARRAELGKRLLSNKEADPKKGNQTAGASAQNPQKPPETKA